MPKFVCPNCGAQTYSAWDHRTERLLKCYECGAWYENPYFDFNCLQYYSDTDDRQERGQS